VVVFSIIVAVGMLTSEIPVSAACVSVSSDLRYGATDKVFGGPITILQTYLQSVGLLKNTPTGHFGPATLSAVKVFQVDNNISSTGFVGPLTRTAINKKICTSGSSGISTAVSTPVQSPVSAGASVPTQTTAVSPTPANVGVTSPTIGQVLSIASSTMIRWNTSPSNNFNIILEQPGGVGAGFITQALSSANGNQYLWKVGTVFSSQTNSNQTVLPGTYRIKIVDMTSTATSSDQMSGWFTIVTSQFMVDSVSPSSAPADNSTAVVLFGSGLTAYTSIYFDTNNSGTRVWNSYVSPDGTVLVFTIPTTVSSGSHTLFINNGSNAPVSLPFTVTTVQ